MEEEQKKINRRDFMGQAGLGVAAMGTFPGKQLFPRSRVIGANDRIRIGIIGAGDRGQEAEERVTATECRMRRGGRCVFAASRPGEKFCSECRRLR